MEGFDLPNPTSFIYTPFYCEENVYLLCKKLCMDGVVDVEDLFVAFIINEKKQVPLWRQKASQLEDGFVVWDYHVICIQRMKCSYQVWDLDSTLQFPSSLSVYMAEAIRPSLQNFVDFPRLESRHMRMVHAQKYLINFASDRRHMMDSSGNWIAPPPLYHPIIAYDGMVNNLSSYIHTHVNDDEKECDMKIGLVYTEKFGVVVRESQLERFFAILWSSTSRGKATLQVTL